MSDGACNREEVSPPPSVNDERSAPGPEELNGNDQIPTPPRSNSAPSDYSDVAPVDSQDSTSKRRTHQRGGRKEKRKSELLQSVTELEIPLCQTQEHDAQAQPESNDQNSESDDYDAKELLKARSSRRVRAKNKRPSSTTPEADTGIRAFNLKRAESSGGGRPIGVTIERPKSEGKGKKEKKKKKKEREKSEQSSEESSEEDEDEEEKKKTEGNKSVSIRLDLNLELEIFLKAKIKGHITVTFLE